MLYNNVKWLEPQDLINSERLDIIIKIKYIENREKNLNLKFLNNLYKRHIEAFSYGTFIEPDNAEKNSILKYIEEFDKIIDSVKVKGIDEKISQVPINSDNVILNGAHRVASAIYFHKLVPTVLSDKKPPFFDVNFMKKRHMLVSDIDYTINEYIKMTRKNIYVAIIWPRVDWKQKKETILNIFNENGKIIYLKEVKLNYNGLRNFIMQLYENQEWIGNYKNHYKGINGKLNECYGKHNTTIIFFEALELSDVLEIKRKIRDIFHVGNHSIHITDTHKEAIEAANMILNKNTIDFLNSGKPDKYILTNSNLQIFIDKVKQNNLDLDDFIIASSSVLALYGMREAGDIDYFSIEKNQDRINNNIIECQDKYLDYYEKSKEELLYNPSNYFRYRNIKFVIPYYVKKFKVKRNNIKDKIDVKLLQKIEKNTKGDIGFIILKMQNYIFHIYVLCIAKIKKVLKFIMKKIFSPKLYHFLVTKYHHFRGWDM